MADSSRKKEIIYQVKGADGLYHSVPESEMEAFHQRQEYLRNHPGELEKMRQTQKQELSDLLARYPQLRSSRKQNPDK